MYLQACNESFQVISSVLAANKVKKNASELKRLLLDEFSSNISLDSSVSPVLLMYFCQVLYLLWIYTTSRSGIWVHIFAQNTEKCCKATEAFWGEFEECCVFFKWEYLLVPSLCPLPCDYYYLCLFKGFNYDLFVMDLVWFLHNVRWLITSKHCISVLGKLVEKLFFHSPCGSLKCLHSLLHGLPFLIIVKYDNALLLFLHISFSSMRTPLYACI